MILYYGFDLLILKFLKLLSGFLDRLILLVTLFLHLLFDHFFNRPLESNECFSEAHRQLSLMIRLRGIGLFECLHGLFDFSLALSSIKAQEGGNSEYGRLQDLFLVDL